MRIDSLPVPLPRPAVRSLLLLALASLALASLAAACAGEAGRAGDPVAGAATAPADIPAPPAPAGVGGAGSLEAALADFRRDLPPVAALDGGEADRDALVRRFARAVERSDTTDLRAMAMTRSEFAYLYYPTSPYTRRPTRQAANIVWFLHLQDSQKGVTRALNRYGGRPLHLAGYACAPEPRRSGRNLLWHDCVLELAAPGGDTTRLRLFGPILERDGRFKLYSYANDL